MAPAALVIYAVGLMVTFGLRSWLQWRRTGSTGFVGVNEPRGSTGWWSGVLFGLVLISTLLAPLAVVSGIIVPTRMPPAVAGLGVVLAVVGLGATFVAQNGMGASWRIGVDHAATTELVTTGVFAWVRNPIFTAMIVALLGLPLMVFTWLSVLTVVLLVVAVEIQVRVVEEPYLARVHGEDFAAYTSRTGRFLPGIGARAIEAGR
ncbi:isoprenylcysteine carboxylmethyltransferase family protein [Nonomuraea turkmeniaca]|uniref:Isoprenylcysteine carboxylmethyltransferase family protein n=1 Tax=Nonomuraea turkmeniaca TaxID=103838 RepID=A0A5S4EXB2_9ACTN|nr:isoprenylcysteine carboxylmethyltransferase family protein [Nonomuraea turkmeniaca]TMR08125.1 isoprenylcysteine carboxylmethyltransferase family protein [Nonomuraea turkmeniaca]